MRRLLPLLFCFVALPLFAWGEKGHYLVNEAATHGVPTDMPAFFHKAYPELIWLAYDPDRWKNAGPSADDAHTAEHYLDLEFVAHLELPPKRYQYIDLLYTSGTLRRKGIGSTDPGFVPWRITELSELLTHQFRRWRTLQPGPERDYLERDIIHTAGILGHYVGDTANPHHTSIHHNGWVSSENPKKFPNDCEAHSRFETRWVSHAVDLKDVTPKVAAPVLRTDYWATAIGFVRESNGLVETLYTIDRDGGFDVFRPISKRGLGFATDRLAAGASMLRDLWWSAWKNSEKRAPRRED